MAQANIDILTAAATATGSFGLVAIDAPHEFGSSDFPNFIVYDRELLEISAVTVGYGKYNASWRYHATLITRIDLGQTRASQYTTHEALVLSYLQQLFSSQTAYPHFELAGSISPFEGPIGGHMAIISELTFDRVTHYDIDGG